MQYESSITSGLNVMAKVKVFVSASHADADADTTDQGYHISSLDIRPGSLKRLSQRSIIIIFSLNTGTLCALILAEFLC